MPELSLELYEWRSLFCSFTSFSKNVTSGRTSACRSNKDNDILVLMESEFCTVIPWINSHTSSPHVLCPGTGYSWWFNPALADSGRDKWVKCHWGVNQGAKQDLSNCSVIHLPCGPGPKRNKHNWASYQQQPFDDARPTAKHLSLTFPTKLTAWRATRWGMRLLMETKTNQLPL